METASPTPTDEVGTSATTGGSVLIGSLWNGLNSTLPQLYTLVQSVVAARVLGPVDMGRQSFIAWAAITVKLLVTGGVPRSVVRFVADALGRNGKGEARAVVALAWRIELVGATLATGVLTWVAIARPELRLAWLLAAATCGLTALHGVPHAALSGAQLWRNNARIGLVLGAVATVGTVLVLVGGGGITGMFAIEAAVASVSLAVTTVRARRALAGGTIDADVSSGVRTRFVPYAALASLLIALEVVVWKRSEFFFLERYAGPVSIAHYSVAFAMAAALAQLVEGLAGVLSPAIATLWSAGEAERVRFGVGRAWRLLTLASLPLTAGAIAVGPATLQIIYGDAYRSSGTVFVLLMAGFPLLPAGLLGTSVLLGLGRLRWALIGIVAAATVDIGLAVTLIPGRGAEGAALANVAGQVVASVAALVFARRVLGHFPFEGSSLLRTSIASVAAGIAAAAVIDLLPSPVDVPVAVVAGGSVLAVAIVGLRALPAADLRWISEVAGRRLGGLVGRCADVALAGRR